MSDERDRPKKKKRQPIEAEPSGWQQYKMSPIRFAILFALLAVLAVAGYMLYQKKQREGAASVSALRYAVC